MRVLKIQNSCQKPQNTRDKGRLIFYCWRAVASQLTILYNSEILPKSVGCKIVDLRSRFISGHSGMLVNARGNIDQFSRPAPLENKDTMNEVEKMNVFKCLWKHSSRS